jgi:hypothetical protein
VEDDTNEDTSVPQVYRWRVSEDDVHPKVLENIAQAIKSQERSTRTSEHGHAYDSSDGSDDSSAFFFRCIRQALPATLLAFPIVVSTSGLLSTFTRLTGEFDCVEFAHPRISA